MTWCCAAPRILSDGNGGDLGVGGTGNVILNATNL